MVGPFRLDLKIYYYESLLNLFFAMLDVNREKEVAKRVITMKMYRNAVDRAFIDDIDL